MNSVAETGSTAPAQEGERRAWLMIAAVCFTLVAWASAFVVIRFVARDVSPGALALGRLVVASVVLSLLMIGRRRVSLQRREWALVALIGVAWFAIYNIALNAGERHVDAGTASMLIQFAPILLGVLAGFILGEGFPRSLVIGGIVAFSGTLVIGIATSTGDADVIGVALVLIAAFVYAVAMIAQKLVLRRIPALQVTWLACVIGTVACLPFAGALVSDLARSAPITVAGIVYLGVVPTALAFSAWAYALARMSAGTLGVTSFVIPPLTIAMAWIFLGEVPMLLAVIGGAVSVLGVAMARRPQRRTRDRDQARV